MQLPLMWPPTWQSALFIALCVVVLILLIYYLFYFSRLAFYKAPVKDTYHTHAISVIICARDEAHNLATNLPGALLQQYPTTHEVIVVNDNSYDDSKYLLDEFRKEFKQLKVVELTQEAKGIPGKKFPLSVGIKSAKHEILLLTDADCAPASDLWIQKMQNAYNEDTEVVLGYSPFYRKGGLLNKVIRWETFLSALQYLSYALAGNPYMGVGRNLSYKRNLFMKSKGFSAHHNLPGGDDDLFINSVANKNNTAICIEPESFTLSKAPNSFKAWKKQKQRHYTTSNHYKFSHQFLLGLFSGSQFLFYPLLIATAVFFSWQYALIIFGIKFIVQSIIYYKAMKKLNETDLFPYLLALDIWMFFYYLIFAPALFKKPAPTWK